MKVISILSMAFAMLCTGPAFAAAGASLSDAPELGNSGPLAVGFREIVLNDGPQAWPGNSASARPMPLAIWYPAERAASSQIACYRFSPPPIPNRAAAKDDKLTECGTALADAAPVKAHHPVVLISHGYGGWATGFSWLAENLASKGYVVISIDHRDLPAATPEQQSLSFAHTVMTRSADQRHLIETLASRRMPKWLDAVTDPDRIALIGYSMGGFGALATAGAPYLKTGALAAAMQGRLPETGAAPAALKALILFAPWGGAEPLRAWSAESLATITLPTLMLVGREDDVVTYSGVDWIFDSLGGSKRLMIVYDAARHNIAANAVPAALAGTFDYRERLDEPVWRKDRLNTINAHFITALLDSRLKGDAKAADFLRLPTERAEDGVWPLEPGSAAGAALATSAQPDHWPGFQRRWAVGMSHRSSDPRALPPAIPERGQE